MTICTFCNRRAFADAELSSAGHQWLYVCKSHFLSEGATFREGRATLVTNAPAFEDEDLNQSLEGFMKENDYVV